MQPVLGASLQNILRRSRPFRVDEKLDFALVEPTAEQRSEIAKRGRIANQALGAVAGG